MGLKFSLEKEAKTFAQIARDITITGHYKSDSSSLTVNTNDKTSTGDASENRTTTSAPPPPPAKKATTLSRPPRPKSMYREAPKSPPPPPPPSANSRNPVILVKTTESGPATVPSKASLPSPPTPPPPKVPHPQSLPSTPVNKDAPALITGTFPLQPSVPSSPGPTATLDRKKLNKKITKDMIGVPTNFQHVSHVGFDPDFNFDSQKIQDTFQMSEPSRKTNAARAPPSNPTTSNPPPSNPPPSNPPTSNPPTSNPPTSNPPPSNPTTSNPLPSNPPTSNPPLSNPPPSNPPTSNPPTSNSPPSNPPTSNPPPSNPPNTNPPPIHPIPILPFQSSPSNPPLPIHPLPILPFQTTHFQSSPSNPPPPPGNRNPVRSPASDASPPQPKEAVSTVSAEPSRGKEQTSVCEEPRDGGPEAPSSSAATPSATPSATQVNDAIHCDTEPEEVAAKGTAGGNESETQAKLLLEESAHKAALDTSDGSRNGLVEETINRTRGNDSVMQPSDAATDVDPIPNSTTASLDSSQAPEADMTLNDHLLAKSDASLVGPDQKCQKNENDTENGANYGPTLSANESDQYNAKIRDSLKELEAMLEELSTSSCESVPSQTTAETEIHDRVTHSASEDAGEGKASDDLETSDETRSSCEFLDAQTNVSSTSVLTYDPDQVGHESFDPLEINKMFEGATLHSNFIFSAENVQIPLAPTRYRRKKSKQEPSPPPPPPTPTEAGQIDSEYL
ncbi:proteoglycan 4-like isoform X2 [Macrobrachium rosenbergii]